MSRLPHGTEESWDTYLVNAELAIDCPKSGKTAASVKDSVSPTSSHRRQAVATVKTPIQLADYPKQKEVQTKHVSKDWIR